MVTFKTFYQRSLSLFLIVHIFSPTISQPVYKIGSLFPTDSANEELQDLAVQLDSAYRIACEEVNKTLVNAFIECLSSTNVESLISQSVVGVVGSIVSSDSKAAATILGAAQIPQISPASTDPTLSSDDYAWFLRTITPDNFQGASLLTILQKYEWRNIAIISSNDNYGQLISSNLVAECAANNITVLTYQLFASGTNSTNLSNQIQAILDSGATIIVATGPMNDIISAMRAGEDAGLNGQGYAWISSDGQITANIRTGLEYIQGLVTLHPVAGRGKLFEYLKATWANKDPALYPGNPTSVADGPVPDPITFSAQTFDAVYTLARTIDKVVGAGGDPTNGSVLLAALKLANYNLTTGTISFNSDRNSVTGYDVANIFGNQFAYVGAVAGVYRIDYLSVWPSGSTIVPSGERRLTYNLGGVFPTNPSLIKGNPILYDLGIELQTAYRIACETVNANARLASRAKLNCLWKGTDFDRNSSVSAAEYLVSQRAIGLVGSVYSETSEAIASMVSGPMGVPQISPSASAVILSNKTRYPYFLRMSPTALGQVKAISILIDYFKWKQVATIGVGSFYFQNTITLFVEECKSKGITILSSQSFDSTTDRAAVRAGLQQIIDSGARIIFMNAFIQEALVIFEEAALLNMTQQGWGWLGSPQATLLTTNAFKGNEAAMQAMNGFIAIRPVGGVGATYDFLVAEWKSRDPIQYPGLLQQGKVEPITWSPETFDVVFAYAHAIDAVLEANQDPTNGTVLMQALLNVNFTGATGSNNFDTNGDINKSLFDVLNFRDGEFQTVGKLNFGVTNSTWTRTSGSVILWPGGSLDVPLDHYVPPPPTVPEEERLPTGIVVLIIISTTVALGAIVFVASIIIKEKKTGHGMFVKQTDNDVGL